MHCEDYVIVSWSGGEALVSCGIMESLLRVINWFGDDGQDHITVSTCVYWIQRCQQWVLSALLRAYGATV